MPLALSSQLSGSPIAYSNTYHQLSRLRICEMLVENGEPSKYEVLDVLDLRWKENMGN